MFLNTVWLGWIQCKNVSSYASSLGAMDVTTIATKALKKMMMVLMEVFIFALGFSIDLGVYTETCLTFISFSFY